MCVEIVVPNSPKQIGDSKVLSGFDAYLCSFFQHHKANDAPKYSAIFEENDVYLQTILYIFRIAAARPIDLDELGAGVHSPLHYWRIPPKSSFRDIVTVVPRVSCQLNEIIAFVKFKTGAFELANGLYNKRRITVCIHAVFLA
ncbi:MAG: hypothetical protein CMF80_08065 [Candidatus Marinimicrobia bacterium]|nr:hypothetical protein [Candidatus Neomarinimicrobiota bacterium]